MRDADWASTRCLVSFENACILYNSKGMIATVDRSPDKQCVAVGFSNGLLRFYRYPTTTIMASYLLHLSVFLLILKVDHGAHVGSGSDMTGEGWKGNLDLS